jgi:nucleoside-diphosphate-sugar epimerase
MFLRAPTDEAALEQALSAPSPAAVHALAPLDGDIMVLGAGGKMGPTLARMARRALDAAGVPREGSGARRVYAVARFSDTALPDQLASHGVVPLRADLTRASALAALPDAPNVLHLVGQKFGTQHDPAGTWMQNVGVAVHVAERFASSRIVMFSTGNVYPRSPVAMGGVTESHALDASGEYAASCVGRERIFQHAASQHGTRVLLYRLCYACDLRYGVLTDIAVRVQRGEPVPLAMGHANVIWQGDANALALRALSLASSDATALNVSGPIVSVRDVATQLAARLGVPVSFEGTEADDALLVDTSRLRDLLPFDGLPMETLLDWTAQWVQSGQRLLGKPTKFELRSGSY